MLDLDNFNDVFLFLIGDQNYFKTKLKEGVDFANTFNYDHNILVIADYRDNNKLIEDESKSQFLQVLQHAEYKTK